MNKTDNIKKILEKHPEYQETLFIKGYLISSKTFQDLNTYPFFGNWKEEKCGSFQNGDPVNVYYHNKQDYYKYEEEGITAAIIGHAYNPFDMKYKEEEILKDCVQEFKKSEKAFLEKISELTGVHLIIINDNGNLIVLQDCVGLKACYYGKVKDDVSISSHPQLIGDIYNLKVDPTINKLINKWFYPLGGSYLPGDLSPYKSLKRLGPNLLIRYTENFELERFYPTKNHPEINEDEYEETLEEIAEIISRNIELCSIKWEKPAISLTGGMDSKTTFACANGFYDKYKYYSFYSKPQELVDAKAAKKICENNNLTHNLYEIPKENSEIQDFDVLKNILFHNSSYIEKPKDNEIRKFIYMSELNNFNDFDVELKSWISEIGRAIQGKKYGIDLPNILTPRHFSIFQTRYFGSPSLLKHSDKNYKDYLKRINLDKPLYNYEHGDLYLWEFKHGSWLGNVVNVQDVFNFTVTLPMNNRKLADMLLWFPHEYRKKDMINKGIINIKNKKLLNSDTDVTNKYLVGKRVIIEKLFYYYRTLLHK